MPNGQNQVIMSPDLTNQRGTPSKRATSGAKSSSNQNIMMKNRHHQNMIKKQPSGSVKRNSMIPISQQSGKNDQNLPNINASLGNTNT